MAPRPSQTPPSLPQLSSTPSTSSSPRCGSSSSALNSASFPAPLIGSSLEGLERVMHDLPAPAPLPVSAQSASRNSGRSASSRKSSNASNVSVNKPLPPEPPPPLFSITSTSSPWAFPPSPSPSSFQSAPRQGTGSRSASAVRGGSASPASKISASSVSSKTRSGGSSPALRESSPGLTRRRELSPLSTTGFVRPVSSTPSAIIESYIDRDEDAGVTARSGTPLIAPQAKSPQSPDVQEERLHAFERYGTEGPTSRRATSTSASVVDVDELAVQRKGTVAYRLDPSSESDPQVTFQQPVWADDASQSDKDSVARCRDSLEPPPFSPSSMYDDDGDTALTPTIPVLPPIPANSPFKFVIPVSGPVQSPLKPPTRAATRSPSEFQAVQSYFDLPHGNSHQTRFESSSAEQRKYPQAQQAPCREFGSQASWEPGDDAARTRLQSSATEKKVTSSYKKLREPSHHDRVRGSRPPPREYSSSSASIPHKMTRPSSTSQMSGASSGMSNHTRTPTDSSYVTDVYEDEEQQVSKFSDDSGSEKSGKFSSLLQRPRKYSATKPLGARSSNRSIKKTPTLPVFDVVQRTEPNDKEAGYRKSASDKARDIVNEMDDTLRKGLLLNRYGKDTPTHDNENAHQRHGHVRILSVTGVETPGDRVSAGLVRDSEGRKPSLPRSQTCAASGISLTGGKSDGESIRSSGSEPTWFSKLLRKKRSGNSNDQPRDRLPFKTEAERQKWRDELKQKIRVIQDEPQEIVGIAAVDDIHGYAHLGARNTAFRPF